MNIVLIPTRIDSSRLPGKASFNICGLSLLDYVILAGKQAKTIDLVGVITTDDKRDIKFVNEYSEKAFTYSWDGDRNDVLGRFIKAIEEIEKRERRQIENVVRLTHDCPLLAFHSYLIDEIMMYHVSNHCDFSHNKGNYCSGLDVEIMTKTALLDIYQYADDKEIEHVTLCFKNHPDKYKIGEFNSYGNNFVTGQTLFEDKWSIDTYEEFKKVSDIIKMYNLKGINFNEYGFRHEFKIR